MRKFKLGCYSRHAGTPPNYPSLSPYFLSTRLKPWSGALRPLLWCVVRVVGGPLYSLERSVPTIPLYGNVANRLLEDQINLSAKIHLDGKQGRFGRPYFIASGHRPSLVHCLVGPDVRWLVPGLGWSVWTVRWASFAW